MKNIKIVGLAIVLLTSANVHANNKSIDQALITSSIQEILVNNINDITLEVQAINASSLIAGISFKGNLRSTDAKNKTSNTKTAILAD